MSSLKTNFNVSPYFDDYDENKDFYKVLFRPSVAVQARELTQLQTILQKQIERFGNHVFKDGSIVDGVGINYIPNASYILLSDQLDGNGLNTNTNLLISELNENYIVTNGTDANAVRASISLAKSGIVSNAPETNRLYVKYYYTGKDSSNNDVSKFSSGDKIYIYNENQGNFANLDSNNLFDTITSITSNSTVNATGTSYLIQTTEGIIFQKGYFSAVEKQIITVKDFDANVAGYVVGFDTTESVVNDQEDLTLTDNALGYPNENAPGAFRLKLKPTLVSKLASDSSNSKNFFTIVSFDDTIPVEQRTDPEYNTLQQSLSRRTFEESGNYVTKPFIIEATNNNSNSSNFYYTVSSGVAYVRGNRVEKLTNTLLEASKGTSTQFIQNKLVTANYGNYIICNEFLGTFDVEQNKEIELYDEAQTSLSDYEGVNVAPIGNLIGYANVRAVSFIDGTKGLPDARYYVYLFNIRMNSGKTFSSDVKSIFLNSGTFGNAKADIILENGVAVIKDSDRKSLIFDTGLDAVKRLTNNTGIGDTLYTYNQIKSSTISSAGSINITLDTAAAGASLERLNYGIGSLNLNSIDQFDIYLGANVYTANLTGDIDISPGTTTINANTATDFENELEVGSLIYVYDGAQPRIRRVVSIANSSQIEIDNPISTTNNSADYAKYYVEGSPLPLTSVTVNSNTNFVAETGLTLPAGPHTVYASYQVNRNEAISIPKLIRKGRYVKIDCATNSAGSIGPWDLGFTDIHKIKNIYVGTTYSLTNPNRITWFNLDNGQRDSFYDHGKLEVKPQYSSKIDSTTKLLIELDYFVANTDASVGFFSVESYPIDDANTSNTNSIQTIEIPKYDGKDLRNYIDFRIRKHNTATDSTTEASASENPAVSNSSFDVPSSGQHTIIPDENFIADFEYFLPRYDVITLDSSGNFGVIEGQAKINPQIPFTENDQTLVAQSFVPPYPSPTKRQFDIYKDIPFIRVSLKTNRRYTMKDIGTLDKRLKRVEYYTVLNALEQEAKNLTVPDANGLDRFKNGIFVDPFNSHNLGQISDFEYKISIDKDETVARPFFISHDADLQFSNTDSTNVQRTGKVITLPFTEELFITQKFATKFRNASESFWAWTGDLDLFPSEDFWRDEEVLPNVNIDLDIAAPFESFADSPFGTVFGDWRTLSTSSTSSTQTQGQTQTTTTVTTTQQERTVTDLEVNTFTEQFEIGSYVKDVSINPYIRSRLVAFVCNFLKPNTRIHAHFDEINVDAHCIPGVLSGLATAPEGREDRVVRPLSDSNFGDALFSDENGFLCGLFRIPAETFRTGDRLFQLSNVEDLTIGRDAILTMNRAVYTADSISVTRETTNLNIRQPILFYETTTDTRTQTDVSTSVVVLPRPTFDGGDGDSGDSGESGESGESGDCDPIGQSFVVSNSPDGSSASFISSLGVYFRSKDDTLGITCFICQNSDDGSPDTSKIFAKSHLSSSEVLTSETGLTETRFIFDYPICILNSKSYSFVIQPDGNSPEYEIWTCETGDFDINTDEQVFSNPFIGVMFVSANLRNWTAYQKEDIKFNIYRAIFSPLNGSAVFKNEDDEFLTIDGFTRSNTEVGLDVGDIVYTVNSSVDISNSESVVSNTLNDKVYGRIQYFNEVDGEIWLDSSTANTTSYFSNTVNPTVAIYRIVDPANTSQSNATTLITWGNVISVDDLSYHTVVPKFGVTTPSKTFMSYNIKGTSNSDVVDVEYTIVENDKDYEFNDYERKIYSRSNEINQVSGDKTLEYKLNLTSSSKYVSPVINLGRKNSLFVENIINNDYWDENTRYGNSLSRYISKKVILEDGQEAEDLEVYLTAYKPTATNIKVYGKFLNNQDGEEFNTKTWTELEYVDGGENIFSSDTNTKNFIEYKFKVPSKRKSYLTLDNNTVVEGETATQGTNEGIVSFAYGNNVIVEMNSGILDTGSVTFSISGALNIVESEIRSAFANTGTSTPVTLSGAVSCSSDSNSLSATEFSFSANTNVDNVNDVIAISDANTYFEVGNPLIYSANGGTDLTNLITGGKYYVSFSNSSHIAVSETRSGANIDLTASSLTEDHHFTGTFFSEDFTPGDKIRIETSDDIFSIKSVISVTNNTSMTLDTGFTQSNSISTYYIFNSGVGDGIVEYENSDSSRFVGFKEFAIKIVLLSSNPIRVPMLEDVRAIALQI